MSAALTTMGVVPSAGVHVAVHRRRAARLRTLPPVRVSCQSVPSARSAAPAGAADEPAMMQTRLRLSALAFTAAAAAQRMGATFATTMTQASAEGASLQKRLRLGASVVPLFAAISSSTAGATLPLITSAVASFIKLYLLLLFVRVLLTWFPNVDWMGQPWVTLRQVTDPYLNLFRNLIPPLMGQIDFTPIFGFLVLQFLVQVLGADDIYSV